MKKNIFGYIEGYYGKILTWEDRKVVIDYLAKNNMNSYLYAPKSDVFHRLNWKKDYPNEWYQNFSNFCKYAKRKGIDIIAGISPGLDFNFQKDIEKTKDFLILKSKAKKLLSNGANIICLMMDDIPNFFDKNAILKEGKTHALLANTLCGYIGNNLLFVPRIYADELKSSSNLYLEDLNNFIDSSIGVFFSGKNIVSKSINNNETDIHKILKKNKIIFWDNLYANDYCPRKLFVGPWVKRDRANNIMINGTGMIHTDLLILNIVGEFKKEKNRKTLLFDIYKKNNIPEQFLKISKFFNLPDFGNKPHLKEFTFNQKHLDCLDFLLWKWSTDLSIEWYPFLMGLKQDMLIASNQFNKERIIKTQTIPLAAKLLYNLTNKN